MYETRIPFKNHAKLHLRRTVASDESRSESYEMRNMGHPFCGSRWDEGQVYGCQTEGIIEAKLREYLS